MARLLRRVATLDLRVAIRLNNLDLRELLSVFLNEPSNTT
jgi:hypothetical protein